MNHLGLTDKIKDLIHSGIEDNELARVTAEHKERYIVQSGDSILQAEITGNIRFTAQSRADFPAVGDWVKIMKMDEQNAIIVEVLPRFSVLERKEAGKTSDVQIIASNIDYAFIVQAVGHDFNLNRIERYIIICNSSGIAPIILLTKTDLIEANEIEELVHQIKNRVSDIPVIALSSQNGNGYEALYSVLQTNLTYCFMGSSGVGKSTIINCLKNEDVLKTNTISSSTGKGRHTTSHRELFTLSTGSIVIDTPGMRELGLADQAEGITTTYSQIEDLAPNCKYADCSHNEEKGCAVIDAVETGDLSVEIYENYMKLKREQEHFSSTVQEKRQKDKDFGKMVREVKKIKKNHKF